MPSEIPKLRMGTCNWKYDSWRNLIYSNEKKINYLQEYSRHYNTVEIDQWFWSLFGINKISLPSPSTVLEYSRSVPPDFKFTVKVPNSITLTHFYKQDRNDPLVANPYFLSVDLFDEFLKSIEPLRNQLGPLMFQFEYLNRQKIPSQNQFQEKFLDFLRKTDPACQYALEIRNPNYLNDSYFQFLRENHLGMVFLQGYYMPPVFEVYEKFKEQMGETAVIRLHGPDRSEIEKISGGNWNRIWEPKDEELSKIAQMIIDLLGRKRNVYVNVNNHYEGSAPLSIRRLTEILESLMPGG
ncbi:MAG: DUF72 domain-containing protein [Calditrichia bacterium]